jgi:hypothetical protein
MNTTVEPVGILRLQEGKYFHYKFYKYIKETYI